MAENSLCSVCSAVATHFCMCKSPIKLYFCETCCSRHVFKGDVGHSTLRIKADGLVSSAEDIRPYNSRLEAIYQLNTSLDSLSQQAYREKTELQGMVGQMYERQVAELYAAYSNICLKLQAKYDGILQELFTIKSEVSSLEHSSVLSPITITLIESYVHIRAEVLIDCATEIQRRIIVTVQPYQDFHNTPLQEVLTKWHCQQCQQCAAFKEKILMKKVREQGVVVNDAVWTCLMCKYEYNMKETKDCTRCHAPNPHPAQPAQQPPLANSRPVTQQHNQPLIPDAVWTCPQCKYKYNLKGASKCLKCETQNPRVVPVAQQPARRISRAALPVKSDVSTNSQFQPAPSSSNGKTKWKCMQCQYEQNRQDEEQCYQCDVPRFAPQDSPNYRYQSPQPLGNPQYQQLNPSAASMLPYGNQQPQAYAKKTKDARPISQYSKAQIAKQPFKLEKRFDFDD